MTTIRLLLPLLVLLCAACSSSGGSAGASNASDGAPTFNDAIAEWLEETRDDA